MLKRSRTVRQHWLERFCKTFIALAWTVMFVAPLPAQGLKPGAGGVG